MIHRYEDELYYFVWKHHRLPTTRGNERSFLDILQELKPSFFCEQEKIFTREEEYGLVNRLDNDTAGLLYFAKTKQIYENYAIQQKENKLYKLYICEVYGKVDCEKTAHKSIGSKVVVGDMAASILGLCVSRLQGGILQKPNSPNQAHYSIPVVAVGGTHILNTVWKMKGIEITYPIIHHIHDKTRMVAVAIQKDLAKGRDKMHHVTTYMMPLWYNSITNTTVCFIALHQGIRHQIRVHTAKIGYPIVGDILYNTHTKGLGEDLHLWSVGLSSDLQFSTGYVL